MERLRIATVDPRFVTSASRPQLADWQSYFDPDLIALTGTDPAQDAVQRLTRSTASAAEVVQPAVDDTMTTLEGPASTELVVATSVEDLQTLQASADDSGTADSPTYVLSALLALDVDTTRLETTLEGRDAYTAALDDAVDDSEMAHLSTRVPTGYRRDWDGLTVVGAGQTPGHGDSPLVALDCRTDGRILTRTVTPTQLGLRAVNGIGEKRSQTLREAGIASRDDLLAVDPHQLLNLPGVGQATADRIHASAQAIEEGVVIRRSDDELPSGDPIFIDIETDGLNPTITWLIGVLDGGSDDGHYMGFLQKDPSEPGEAIGHFLSWYRANAAGRPIVAYNGWDFDFHVLQEHIADYCPDYEPVWSTSYRFDPLDWATSGNAFLPGRTNELADVATALGYDWTTPGLTGAAVARTYQAWMADQSPATEPDWDTLQAYCEDDVRALATVYEALEAGSRADGSQLGAHAQQDASSQQDLSNW